jgi:NADH-quinone oxidoreductase subunit K
MYIVTYNLYPYCFARTMQIQLQKLFNMDLVKYLIVSFTLFLIGIWGIFFNRKNILVMLMSIELMLLSVNLNFLFFSVALDDILGQVFALFELTVAAAESAIGLALLVVYYRVRGTVAVEFINLIKG